MYLQVESFGEVNVVRVKKERLIYPDLRTFSAEISALIEEGTRKLVINLSEVSYMDSASYGCLMDIYRMMSEQKGTVTLVGLQERVPPLCANILETLRSLKLVCRAEEDHA